MLSLSQKDISKVALKKKKKKIKILLLEKVFSVLVYIFKINLKIALLKNTFLKLLPQKLYFQIALSKNTLTKVLCQKGHFQIYSLKKIHFHN